MVAPVTEEASKGLFLLLLLWWRRAELDGVLDGIVYAGMVGIGFAFIENILYLAAAYNGTDGMGPGGTDALTTTFVVRCLFSPFAHPLFTRFTGIGVGIAVASTLARCGSWPRSSVPAGRAAHAIWNTSTLYGCEHFVRRLLRPDGARVPRRWSASPSGRAARSAGCWPAPWPMPPPAA